MYKNVLIYLYSRFIGSTSFSNNTILNKDLRDSDFQFLHNVIRKSE